METRTIKGVSEEKWILFKTLAAKNNEPMGKTFEIIVESYTKNTNDVWDRILNGGKTLTDKETDEMKKELKKMRKEKGFRNVSIH